MLFSNFLLVLMLNIFASAAPATGLDQSLDPRQIVTADPTVACCTSCGGRYDYTTFWHVFDDFCNWAGYGMQLWTTQEYYTGDYYCQADSSVCIHLIIQYNGGQPNGDIGKVDYPGCMGYFGFSISPSDTCGGSPYPGAQVFSSDGNWMFQATADLPGFSKSKLEIECTHDGRFCHVPGVNGTLRAPEGMWDFSA